MRSFVTIFLKTLLYTVLVFLLVLGVLGVSLQLPTVQTKLVRYVAKRLSTALQYPVDVGRVAIKWFDTVALEDVSLRDRRNQPMIDVGRLEVNFNLRQLIDSSATNIHLDEVLVYQPNVRLVKNQRTGALNVDEFLARINELLSDPNKPSIPNQNIPFTIGKATLLEGRVSYDDPREQPMPDKRVFDYNHFVFNDVNANLKNFLLLGDTISMDIGRLRAEDKRAQLAIHQLQTNFLYCAKQMRLDQLYANINGSFVGNRLIFDYKQFSDFNDFNEKVVMRVNLRKALVRAQDLVPFTDYFAQNFDVARADVDFVGTVHNFRVTDADIRFGQNSRLVGDFAFKGLPNADRTVVDFRIRPSDVLLNDLQPYYSGEDFNRVMAKLGRLAFSATYTGRFTDFVTRGTFQTNLGGVSGEFALKWLDDVRTTYRGDLALRNLKVGQLLDRPDLITQLDGQARFNGHGLTLQTATLDLDGRFNRIHYNDYGYRNVNVRGNLQRSFFSGQVSVRDTNLTVSLDGEFNLRGKQNLFDVRGTIQRANLLALRLADDSLTIRTDLDLQLTGNTLNEMEGDARFQNAYLTLGKRTLLLDTLHVSSDRWETYRNLHINSDLLTSTFWGNFQPSQTLDDLQRLVREYSMNFAGDAAAMAAYYKRKRTLTTEPYLIDYQINLKNSQPLLAFFYPNLYLSPNTRFNGQFAVDRTSLLTMTGAIDTLRLDNYLFVGSTLDLTTSKYIDSPNVLASLQINSSRQKLGPLAATERLVADAAWQEDHIDFRSSLRQVSSTNRANLNGALTFKGDAIDIELKNSRFRLLDSTWTVAPDNLIRIVGPEVTVRGLTVANRNQLIAASGKVSTDSLQELRLQAQNFLLQTLNPVFNTRLSGKANAQVNLRDLYGLKLLDGQIRIDSLKYDNFLIGNLVNRSTLDRSNRINIDTRVQRLGREVITVLGNYDPRAAAESPLDLRATLTGAELRILEPFTRGYVSNLTGETFGTVAITGKPTSPQLNGSVDVRGGRLMFDYLKATVAFQDKVYFEGNEVRTRQMQLTDPSGNKATLNGGVYFPDYKYYQLGLTADMRNFRILNTTAKDNDLFYGTAIVTGRTTISGPIDNLTIEANVSSNKGTRIYIPFDQARTVADESIIRLINTSAQADSSRAAMAPAPPEVDLSGIKMNFNLSITPDAYCEIQLDRQTGDIIKAYGDGQIAMRIDTKGEFTMTGTYEIQQGEYTFTFENIINKRFKMLPDSRINWTGDPYEALVDVKTSYTQYASLAPLLQGIGTNTPDRYRRYPVDLLINLRGRLLAPDITYDLKVQEYPQQPDFRQAVTAFESRLKSNEQELGRQVSSVLLFSQLQPADGGLFSGDPNSNGGVGAGVTNSLSELLSNQLSRLASNLDQNLDVGVSLNGLDQNLVNNLQVRFSYRFNDRFRISRDGGFTYGQNQTNAASLLGEWTLEYYLSPDGRLRLKMYNRNQLNQLGQLGALGVGTLTPGGGMSIQYTRSFNHLLSRPLEKRAQPGLPLPAEETKPTPPATGTTTVFLEK